MLGNCSRVGEGFEMLKKKPGRMLESGPPLQDASLWSWRGACLSEREFESSCRLFILGWANLEAEQGKFECHL